MRDQVRAELKSRGASLVGFADMQVIPAHVRAGLPNAVSIAVSLNPGVIFGIREGPTKEYWDEYRRANALLAELASFTAGFLADRGYKARALVPTVAEYDSITQSPVSYNPETLSTRLPHKTAATRAGLGWIGKCALLITPECGSALRLTTVLTDADFRTAAPMEESQCGTCIACVEVCPGRAPSGKNWQAGVDRDGFFDAFACRTAAHQLAKTRVGIEETICGICINVCPWTQKYLRRGGA